MLQSIIAIEAHLKDEIFSIAIFDMRRQTVRLVGKEHAEVISAETLQLKSMVSNETCGYALCCDSQSEGKDARPLLFKGSQERMREIAARLAAMGVSINEGNCDSGGTEQVCTVAYTPSSAFSFSHLKSPARTSSSTAQSIYALESKEENSETALMTRSIERKSHAAEALEQLLRKKSLLGPEELAVTHSEEQKEFARRVFEFQPLNASMSSPCNPVTASDAPERTFLLIHELLAREIKSRGKSFWMYSFWRCFFSVKPTNREKDHQSLYEVTRRFFKRVAAILSGVEEEGPRPFRLLCELKHISELQINIRQRQKAFTFEFNSNSDKPIVCYTPTKDSLLVLPFGFGTLSPTTNEDCYHAFKGIVGQVLQIFKGHFGTEAINKVEQLTPESADTRLCDTGRPSFCEELLQVIQSYFSQNFCLEVFTQAVRGWERTFHAIGRGIMKCAERCFLSRIPLRIGRHFFLCLLYLEAHISEVEILYLTFLTSSADMRKFFKHNPLPENELSARQLNFIMEMLPSRIRSAARPLHKDADAFLHSFARWKARERLGRLLALRKEIRVLIDAIKKESSSLIELLAS